MIMSSTKCMSLECEFGGRVRLQWSASEPRLFCLVCSVRAIAVAQMMELPLVVVPGADPEVDHAVIHDAMTLVQSWASPSRKLRAQRAVDEIVPSSTSTDSEIRTQCTQCNQCEHPLALHVAGRCRVVYVLSEGARSLFGPVEPPHELVVCACYHARGSFSTDVVGRERDAPRS